MKKKLLCLLLSGVLCLSCAGCAFTPPSSGETDDPLENEMPSGEDPEGGKPSDDEETQEPSDPSGDEPGEETPSGGDEGTEMEKNKTIEAFLADGYSALFADSYLTNGISLTDATGNRNGSLTFTQSLGEPSWTFAQWYTKYDISDYYSRSYTKGGAAFRYTSKGETIDGVFVPAKVLSVDSTTAEIYMELNAEVEYDAPRKEGEGWPHTLLSQDFSDRLVHVSELDELVMSMDYTVTKFEDKMGDEADPNMHCAQFVWYITLQNRTKGSAGYGQYIWFGLNLWDNRNAGKASAEYAAQDLGKEDATLAFIYQPSSEKFTRSGLIPQVGEEESIRFDIMETAKYAFALAKDRGYLTDTLWEDIYIGSMNFGFEVTGTYNAAVQIDTVGVYYK